MAYTTMDAYTDAVTELATVSDIWNPFQLVYSESGGSVVNQWQTFIHSMQMVGVGLLVLMAALKFVKVFLDELNDIPATTKILGIAVEMILVTVFLFNYTWFAEIFPSLFHQLTKSILASYEASLMDQVLSALKAAGAEKSSEIKWFSINAIEASIPNILSTAAAGLGLALYWVMSKYQAMLYTFWYLIGPILLPFYLFPPFRGVAERWFASLLAASFMGIVGAIMFILMVRAQWLTLAFGAGANASYITALVFAILTLLLMISIPRLSNSIWDGISASLSQSATTGARLGGAATTMTLGTVGAMTQVAGSTLRQGTGVAGILHRYNTNKEMGLSQGRRILDAVRNRDSFASETDRKGAPTRKEKTLSGLYQAGTSLRDMGHGVMMSQMPSSVQRAERALGEAGKARELGRAKRKEQDAVRSYVESRLGAEGGVGEASGAASAGKATSQGLTFPERWRLPRRVGESFEESVKRAGDGFLRSRKVEDTHGSLRREIGKIIGEEQAAAFPVPQNFRLKPRRNQSESEALRDAALGLLRSQKTVDPEVRKKLDQEATMREAVRVLGAERAQKLVIPADWAIVTYKGQSARQALEGSTRALMQKQGLIDKKDENEVAIRYRYALARQRKGMRQGKGNGKWNGKGNSKGISKGKGGKK